MSVFDRGDDFVRVHVREQALAHVVADVDQHLAVIFRIDQAHTTSRLPGGSDSSRLPISAGAGC